MVARCLALMLLLGGCDVVFGFGPIPDAGPGSDSGSGGDARICAAGTAFEPGIDVLIEGGYSVEGARFNPTQTDAYFSLCELDRPTPYTSEVELKSRCDLHSSDFSTTTGLFTDLTLMNGVSAPGSYDSYPTITPDGQHIVFGSSRDGGVKLYVAQKVNNSFDTGIPVVVPLPASLRYSNEPYLLADNQTLYFGAEADSHWDLYRSRGPAPGFGGLAAAVVAGVNGPTNEFAPVVSDDELEIFFASDREDSPRLDIFTSVRTPGQPFPAPTRVNAISSDEQDYPLWLSPDGCELYYVKKTVVATLHVARR